VAAPGFDPLRPASSRAARRSSGLSNGPAVAVEGKPSSLGSPQGSPQVAGLQRALSGGEGGDRGMCLAYGAFFKGIWDLVDTWTETTEVCRAQRRSRRGCLFRKRGSPRTVSVVVRRGKEGLFVLTHEAVCSFCYK